jgi:hypothetical protein
MRRILMLALLLGMGAVPVKAFSEIQLLVQYDCQKPTCNLVCTGPNANLALTYSTLTVFQWKNHVRRLWISVNDTHHVLGDDMTCKFEGRPNFEFGSSPLPPVKPPCNCSGNQCNPPGCRP